MIRKTRKIIFLFCVFVFLVATPGVLLYANGYSFDWEKNALIKTGSFYFDSLPKEAKISFDDKQNNTTPAYIGRLLPEHYSVKISKEGYFDWNKNLEILPQITTEARSVFLVPKEPKISIVADNATTTKDYFFEPRQETEDLKIMQNASTTIADSAGWTIFKNNLYYIQKSNLILYRTDTLAQTPEQLSTQPLPNSSDQFQIKISGQNTAVFVPSDNLYLFNKQTNTFDFLAGDVLGVEFSSDNEKLLFFTKHEIWVLWLADVWSQPYRKQNEKELITRLSDNIDQAMWFSPTSEHIIYAIKKSDDQTQIKITELDGRDQRNTYDIYSGNISEIYFNPSDNLLYVLTEEKLYSLDLLPK